MAIYFKNWEKKNPEKDIAYKTDSERNRRPK